MSAILGIGQGRFGLLVSDTALTIKNKIGGAEVVKINRTTSKIMTTSAGWIVGTGMLEPLEALASTTSTTPEGLRDELQAGFDDWKGGVKADWQEYAKFINLLHLQQRNGEFYLHAISRQDDGQFKLEKALPGVSLYAYRNPDEDVQRHFGAWFDSALQSHEASEALRPIAWLFKQLAGLSERVSDEVDILFCYNAEGLGRTVKRLVMGCEEILDSPPWALTQRLNAADVKRKAS